MVNKDEYIRLIGFIAYRAMMITSGKSATGRRGNAVPHLQFVAK